MTGASAVVFVVSPVLGRLADVLDGTHRSRIGGVLSVVLFEGAGLTDFA